MPSMLLCQSGNFVHPISLPLPAKSRETVLILDCENCAPCPQDSSISIDLHVQSNGDRGETDLHIS